MRGVGGGVGGGNASGLSEIKYALTPLGVKCRRAEKKEDVSESFLPETRRL